MCGRYTRHYTWAEVRSFLDILFEMVPEMPPSYNVAPTQVVPICRLNEGGQRELAAVKWGLVPSWAKDAKIAAQLINARAETVAEQPTFRAAFKARRCIVPVSGFYEWKRIGDSAQPMYVTRADGAIMLFAGLWEGWNGNHGERPTETMTIVTTPPNAFMSSIHNRMPALLEPAQVPVWLDLTLGADQALSLLQPAADGVLMGHSVSERVNSPKHNDPGLCQPHSRMTLFG